MPGFGGISGFLPDLAYTPVYRTVLSRFQACAPLSSLFAVRPASRLAEALINGSAVECYGAEGEASDATIMFLAVSCLESWWTRVESNHQPVD
jgi:hypothetical protein